MITLKKRKMKITMPYNVECTHRGQYRAYGDSYYKFRVETAQNLDRETVIELTGKHTKHWQSKKEWENNLSNPDKYFSGYCEITPQSYGYFVEFCEPYTD